MTVQMSQVRGAAGLHHSWRRPGRVAYHAGQIVLRHVVLGW